jgi:hypothetical protein
MRPARWIVVERDKEPAAQCRREGTIMIEHEVEDRVELAKSIVYLCALIADQPRAIDRYIDYFGETRKWVRS